MSISILNLILQDKRNTRRSTINMTKNLTTKQLDYNFDEFSNSIGTLLFHIATLEYRFIVNNIYVRQITEDEFNKYEIGFPHMMSKRLIQKNDFEYYNQKLAHTENIVQQELSEVSDDWLFKSGFQKPGNELDTNYSFLRHIIDDEINHQGQIKLILKRLPY